MNDQGTNVHTSYGCQYITSIKRWLSYTNDNMASMCSQPPSLFSCQIRYLVEQPIRADGLATPEPFLIQYLTPAPFPPSCYQRVVACLVHWRCITHQANWQASARESSNSKRLTSPKWCRAPICIWLSGEFGSEGCKLYVWGSHKGFSLINIHWVTNYKPKCVFSTVVEQSCIKLQGDLHFKMWDTNTLQ